MGTLTLVTITGTYKEPDGSLLKGKRIKFTPVGVFGDDGIVVPPTIKRAISDPVTAAFSVDLYTSDVVDAYVRYVVEFHDGTSKTFDLTDAADPVTLTDLINAFDGAQAASTPAMLSDHEARIDTLEGAIASGVADGDKGDITVSGSGTVWTVDAGLDAAKIADGTVSNTEFQALNGVTSNIQAQIDGIGGGGASALDDLTDVVITAPASGEFIRHNGTNWVDSAIQASDIPAGVDAAKIADGTVSNAEFQALNGVTSAIQTQLDGKANDSAVVHNTGNETIAGIKTFSSSPIVPAPTTDLQAATKKYVDDAIVAGGGYTDEQAQDAVGSILVDSAEIDLTYNDVTPSISASIVAGSIDETKLDASVNASLDLADTALQSIADDSVTYAKIQNVTVADRILGRITSGAGNVEELTPANVRTIINVADGATANDTDANLKNRANHTGTQLASTISDFNTAALSAAPAETGTTVGTILTGATAKTTLVDADTMPLNDSAASNVLKKITWANIKAVAKTYFDTLYQPVAAVLTNTTASFTTALETKLNGIEAGADVTDATNVDAAGAVMNADASTAAMSFVVDEDNMASDSATKVPTQQSVKAYVDVTATGAPAVTSAITYYVCPAGQTVANYDGDGLNTAVTPSDSNDGLTKATPLATIAAAAAKFAGKVLLAPVTIQLADTDADKAYFPDGVVFDNICSGGSVAVFNRALMSETDVYPTSYVYVKGNTATPNNVAVVGATTYNGTTPSKLHAFICRFSNLRVRGMQFKYFAADCIAGDNRTLLIVESCNGIQLSTYTGLDQDGLVHVSQQSHVKFGGTCTISEMPFVNADNSTVEFGTPLGYVTLNFSASGTNAQFAILADEKSHIYVEGITATFSGSGTYNAFGSLVGSSINWNGDIATNITVNGANITFLKARQGGHISDFSGGFLQTTTFTSMLRRAWAAEHSTITYAGTTQGTSPDLCTGGSTILNGSFPYTAKQTSPMTTYLEFNEVSAPSTPSANAIRLYAKDNAGTSALFVKDDAGTETQLGVGGGSTLPIVDTTAVVKGSVDATKLLRFEVDGFTTGTTRVITPPNADTILPIATQQLTFAGPTAARTITLPDANITVARTDAAQSFTGVQTLLSNPVVSNTAPGIAFTDTTASAKSLTIAVDANLADIRESAGAASSLLNLDLNNNAVGFGIQGGVVYGGQTFRAAIEATGSSVGGLVVQRTLTTGQVQIVFAAGGPNNWESGVFQAFRWNGSAASKTAVVSGNQLFQINTVGFYDGSNSVGSSNITFTAEGTFSASSAPSRIGLFTVPSGSTSPAERLRINAAGSVIIGNSSSALSTSATDGFLYVPTCAGTPTGSPTAVTGAAPIVIDTTNNKLYFRSGGAWRDAGP